MTEQKPAGVTRIQPPSPPESYEYSCQLEEQRRELKALTQSCLKKGFRLCDIQTMYITPVLSTCKYLTDDPETFRTTKQTQTDKMPPEEMIARFVSLLNAVAADLAFPSFVIAHPDISQKSQWSLEHFGQLDEAAVAAVFARVTLAQCRWRAVLRGVLSASGNGMPDQIFRAIPAWGEEPKYNPHIAKAVPYLNEPYPSPQRLHPMYAITGVQPGKQWFIKEL